MRIDDIKRLLKYKLSQHSRTDETGCFVLFDHQIDAVTEEVAAELSLRFTRPVVTFSRGEVLQAATEAGYKIGRLSGEGPDVLVPVDEEGRDIYDKLHKLVDWAVCHVLSRMPEAMLQHEQNSRKQP